jgi:hypothetical protein
MISGWVRNNVAVTQMQAATVSNQKRSSDAVNLAGSKKH